MMGTSSDFKGSSGGAWTPYKRAITDYAKHGGQERLERVIARHVAALGGATAASRAPAAVGGAQRLGGLLSGIATEGLGPTLERLELGHLVGRGRYEVLEALVAIITGPGSDLEVEAARQAACDVIEQLFERRNTFEEMEAIEINEATLLKLLQSFLALCAFYRILPQLTERLTKFSNPTDATELEDEMREFIRALVQLNLAGQDPLSLDWEGAQGRSLLRSVVQGAYQHMESME